MSTVLVDLGAVPWTGVSAVVAPVQNPAPPPGEGEEFGKASPVALVVILALAVATIFLIRSMSKRIRRLPPSFDPATDDDAGSGPIRAEDARSRPAAGGDAGDPGDGAAPRA